MDISQYSEKSVEDKVAYSCEEFTIFNDEGKKSIRFKRNFGKILPFLKKDGVIDAIILNKETENLLSYPTESLNQLTEALEYCNSKEWNVSDDSFIHLGFWKSHSMFESTECVWGLDVNSLENSSNLLSDNETLIIPLSSLDNLEDATTIASVLKLIVKIHTESEEVD